MRWLKRSVRWLVLAGALGGVWLLAPAAARAQPRTNIPVFSMNPPQQQPEADPPLAISETNVGILDPAPIRNVGRVRVDLGWHDHRPVRAEFFQPKPAVLGGRGQALPERNVEYQEAATYAEYAWVPYFSTFAEMPYRWINPDVNENSHGFGDTNFGFRLCTWSDENILATFQFRVYNPTASSGGLGTRHWTVEPGLLASYKFLEKFLLEGECRYWAPVGGSDFAGDVLRYGVGLSYGQRNPGGWWVAPVAEGVGWTVLGGKSVVATTPAVFTVQEADDQTIVNGYVGLRWGFGPHFDSYVGYGRCFTGSTWHRDFARVEVRLLY